MKIETQIVQRVTRAMHCSECGVEAAACDCGAPYIPAGVAAAKAVAAHPEKSDRAIAAEIGVSDKTVGKARKATAEDSAVEPRIGLDGKARKQPATKKVHVKVLPQDHPPAPVSFTIVNPADSGDAKVRASMRAYELHKAAAAKHLVNDALDLVERMDEGQRGEFFDLLTEKYGPRLNAVGKPLSPNYDPKWKRKTPLTSINRLRTNASGLPMVKEGIKEAKQADAHVQDFHALEDADEHVLDYHLAIEAALEEGTALPLVENARRMSEPTP